MSEHWLRVPVRFRDDSLADVACAASALPDPEDQRVVHQGLERQGFDDDAIAERERGFSRTPPTRCSH
jgi:hypothetical protein